MSDKKEKDVKDIMRDHIAKSYNEVNQVEWLLFKDDGMNPDKVNALLYVVGMILSRESEKYKKMDVQLCYNYLPVDKKFTNIIFYAYKLSDTEREDGKICFDNGADFLDIMAELLLVLQMASKRMR